MVQTAVARLAHKHTPLVLAPRLSTSVDADHIIVLGKGTSVEQGKHQQLLDLNGQYARLWQIQVNKQTQG
jgi:ATP-binding cassette subfamily B protein